MVLALARYYPHPAATWFSDAGIRIVVSMQVLRAAVWVLLLCGAAGANTIILTGLHTSLGLQNSLYFDEDGVASQAYWVGGIDIKVDNFSRVVFCVDLFTDINLSTYRTQLDFSDTPQLKRVGWLLQTQLPGITTAAGGAALQLAIWDIVTDNGDGFDPGKGRVTQSTDGTHPTDPKVLATAISLETISQGMSSNFGVVYHNFTTSGGTVVQTLMGGTVNDGGPQPTTPEISPVVLMLSGIGLMLIGRRRRRNSGTIEPHGERPDLRCEELASDARR